MQKVSKMVHDEIIELHKEGMSEREIAKRIGVSRSAVWYHIQQYKMGV